MLCCCTVRCCCCVVVLCCTVVLLLWAPSSSYNTELLHRWVDTLSCNPTVTTPSCYCGLLHCCAVLCCTVVFLLWAPSSSYNTELSHHWVDTLSSNPTVTTPSCHPVVRPHSQHRKVALRGTEVVTSQRSKTGHRPTNRIQSVARERVTVGF